MVIIRSLIRTKYIISIDIDRRGKFHKYENIHRTRLRYVEVEEPQRDYCCRFDELDDFILTNNLSFEVRKHTAPKGIMSRLFMGLPNLEPDEVYYEMYDNVHSKHAIITKHNFRTIEYCVENSVYEAEKTYMREITKELTATEIMEFMRDNSVKDIIP